MISRTATAEGFEQRVLDMLLDAREEGPRRSGTGLRGGRPRRGAIGMLAASLVVGGWVFASSVGGDPTVEVDAAEALRNPRAVERELRQAGIDAEVRTAPIEDPSLQGKWLHLWFPPDVQVEPDRFAFLNSFVGSLDMSWPSVRERCPRGIGCERTAILELPRDTPGPIVLIAGRAPRTGEEGWEHVDYFNELSPTGALYCYGLEEMTSAEAGRRLEDLGYRVIWRYSPVDVVTDMQPDEFLDRPPPGTGVVYAWFRGPNVVDVSVVRTEHVADQRRLVGTPVTPADRGEHTWAPAC